MLTQKRLKEVLSYDPKTGIFKWIIPTSQRFKKNDIAGCFDEDDYVRIGIEGQSYQAHRLAWLYVFGYFPEHGLDHRDRIKHHNWIDNLREASKQCNAINTGNFAHNTSGVKGVYYSSCRRKWVACMKYNQIDIYLGSHVEFIEAACHRLAAEQCLEWSGCDSSSPAFQYVQGYFTRGVK